MILRKPYAFLIKHFKFIHVLLTACMIYLTYKSYGIYQFLGNYIKQGLLRINSDDVNLIFTKEMFILPYIILILLLILLVVMIRKRKPKTFYLFNILVYIITIFMYMYMKTNILEMQYTIISNQLVKLLKDFMEMLTITQLVTVALSTIRALGLDLKKFDFGKDLLELDIDDMDNEEFEVNISVDSSNIIRTINKKVRYAKYIYVENKTKINLGICAIVILGTIFSFLGIIRHNKSLKQYQLFNVDSLNVSINNAYVVKNNYLGNSLFEKDDKRLIVVSLKIKSNKKNDYINTAKTILKIGNNIYYPTLKYNNDVIDLGVPYNNQKLSYDYTNYLLVYEVPKKMSKKNIKFRYLSSIETTKKRINSSYSNIQLKLNDIDAISNVYNSNYGEVIKLNENILKDSVYKISSIGIKKEFINNYNFCIEKDDCYKSVEYIHAPLNSNNDKVVVKLVGEVVKDDEINNKIVSNFTSLVTLCGKIDYYLNDKEYIVDSLKSINYTKNIDKNIIYFEVPEEILSSENIIFKLKVRNMEYRYKIELS